MVDAYFDHAQSPRLGQPVPAEHTSVQFYDSTDLPEISWRGQLVYRQDTQNLQVFNGEAWEDVVGGDFGILTYVGPVPPIAHAIGDLWFDTAHGRKLYRSASIGAHAIATGEWELARDEDIDTALANSVDALGAAADAAAKIDSTSRAYFQDDAPTGTTDVPLRVDDVWYDTNDGYRQYRYNGTTWVTFDVTIRDFTLTVRSFISNTHQLY